MADHDFDFILFTLKATKEVKNYQILFYKWSELYKPIRNLETSNLYSIMNGSFNKSSVVENLSLRKKNINPMKNFIVMFLLIISWQNKKKSHSI